MLLYQSRQRQAGVAELADALDSGSSGSDTVGVQVPSSAPNPSEISEGFFLLQKQKNLSTGIYNFD